MSASRRGIHTLLSVSMLIGMTLAGAGLLLASLSGQGDIVTGGTSCSLSDVSVYDTGDRTGYLVATIHNTGSADIVRVIITLAGPGGPIQLIDRHADLPPGRSLDIMEPFQAPGRADAGIVLASAMYEDGSRTDCIS